MLGILLVIIGVQFIFFGLLAEMIAYSSRREDHFSVEDVQVLESETERTTKMASLRS